MSLALPSLRPTSALRTACVLRAAPGWQEHQVRLHSHLEPRAAFGAVGAAALAAARGLRQRHSRSGRASCSLRATSSAPDNVALVFVKPHACSPQVLEMLPRFLEGRGLEVLRSGSVAAEEIEAEGIIDRHYEAIAKIGMGGGGGEFGGNTDDEFRAQAALLGTTALAMVAIVVIARGQPGDSAVDWFGCDDSGHCGCILVWVTDNPGLEVLDIALGSWACPDGGAWLALNPPQVVVRPVEEMVGNPSCDCSICLQPLLEVQKDEMTPTNQALKRLDRPTMPCVRGISGEELASFATEDFQDVHELKSRLRSLHGFPLCLQQLLFDGDHLRDDDPVKASELTMVLRTAVTAEQQHKAAEEL
ncbi:ANKRD17, partial [Symbiodinium microadriaticum]